MSYAAPISPSLLCSDFSSLPSRPSHQLTTSYNTAVQAFHQDTGYDSSNLHGRQSGLISQARNSTKSSQAFGNKLLSAISENVSVPAAVAATATSLSRKGSLHARARSLASYVPSLNPAAEEQEAAAPTQRFGGLFRATSIRRSSVAPPREEEEEQEEEQSEYIMEYKPSLTGGRDTPRQSLPSQQSSRRFSWFGGNSNATQKPTAVSPAPTEAISLDLLSAPNTLLFPLGAPSPTSPTAYPELLANATALISRLQLAYKTQSEALHTARSEASLQAEESEESATRAAHLKLQLEAMAARAGEQDQAMRAMAAELALEKQRRVDGERKRERRSAGSDSGFESDADTSYAGSVLSGQASRPLTPFTPPSEHGWTAEIVAKRGGAEIRPGSSGSQTARMPGRTCEVDAGVWMFMREEKVRLERRIRDLEGVVEDALVLVGR